MLESFRKPALLLAAFAVNPNAYAGDGGTITFNSSVFASTCAPEAGSVNFLVLLADAQDQALVGVGRTTNRTPFKIDLSHCAAGNVHAYFDYGSYTDSNTGHIKTSLPKQDLQLLNADSTPIRLGAVDIAQYSKAVAVASDGTATLEYFVEYIAAEDGSVTAGDLIAQLTYSIAYD